MDRDLMQPDFPERSSPEAVRRIIEEYRTTAEKLRLGRMKMQLILESIADGVFTVDAAGNITYVSKSLERITGFPTEEVRGRACEQVLKGSACGEECPIRLSVREGDRVEKYRETLVGKDGRSIPVFITTAPIREKDEITGAVCSVQDLTEVENLRKELMDRSVSPGIVGASGKMLVLYDRIESVGGTDVTVLLEGETGVGKELVARAIHRKSGRSRGPFVPVNCSALSPFLLESELFGHVKGAFTGAIRDRKGKFELAEGGTLFLDEISEIDAGIQVKLLRFLQEREIERVGETAPIRVDARIIAATNGNLREMVRKGTLREDLFYRLNVIPVPVPPLRERKEDIPLLSEHFVEKHRRVNPGVEGVSPMAMRSLIGHRWPGNVRELENAIIYAMASCPGKRIERADLPPDIRKLHSAFPSHSPDHPFPASDPSSVERERIVKVLAAHNWRVGETARAIGYSRNTLWRRMKTFGILLPNRKKGTEP